MDIDRYFNRIKLETLPKLDLESLNKLHLQHMLYVPFENLDIHAGRKINLEPELLYEKIVEKKRGGFCYEMNGLFFEIITRLGFKAKRISARVYNENGEPGREFDHMAIIVTLNNGDRLCDVGFGDSFLEPLKFEPELAQKQFGKIYKVVKLDEENFKVVCSSDGKKFEDMYRFSLTPRELNDYSEMCAFHQSSPESHFTKNKICTLAKTDGRITLSGMKFIETKLGVKTETDLKNAEEYNSTLKELFGIVL